MTNLAVFDFDRTVVNEDSDETIIRKLREKQLPPEWDSSNYDWTPYMSNIFQCAFTAGLSQEDILDSIASMTPTSGIIELIEALSVAGWHVIILTDANSVFVEHWIMRHGLKNAVTDVITNRAFWQQGRLYIEPCMSQNDCEYCPHNLCKSLALSRWRASRSYDRVAYVGDGRNDYCPACGLTKNDIVFPRRGFPLDDLIMKTLATPTPAIVAKVVPWDDGNTIIKELLPDKMADAAVTKIESRSSDLIQVN